MAQKGKIFAFDLFFEGNTTMKPVGTYTLVCTHFPSNLDIYEEITRKNIKGLEAVYDKYSKFEIKIGDASCLPYLVVTNNTSSICFRISNIRKI